MTTVLHEQNPLFDVLRIVEETPGLPLNTVRVKAGLGWGSMYQRVEVLKDAGLVRTQKDGRRLRIFPVDSPGPEACRQAAAAELSRPHRELLRQVAQTILDEPGIGAVHLARRVGAPSRSVYAKVRHLVDEGLVARDGPLCRSTLRPTERLRLLLEEARRKESTLQF